MGIFRKRQPAEEPKTPLEQLKADIESLKQDIRDFMSKLKEDGQDPSYYGIYLDDIDDPNRDLQKMLQAAEQNGSEAAITLAKESLKKIHTAFNNIRAGHVGESESATETITDQRGKSSRAALKAARIFKRTGIKVDGI